MVRQIALGLVLALGAAAAEAQEATCKLYEVTVRNLNISRDSDGLSFIDLLEQGDVACVTRQAMGGGVDRGFIAHKLGKPNGQVPVNGWGALRYMKPVAHAGNGAPADVAKPALAAAPSPAPIAPTAAAPIAAPAPAAIVTAPSLGVTPPPAASPPPADSDDIRRFDQPIPFGPVPVNGSTLQALANGVPLFSPLEGLDPRQWQMPCSACHKWDQAQLCDQGKSYAKSPKTVLRHPHPYGGAFKIALMRWARNGCG